MMTYDFDDIDFSECPHWFEAEFKFIYDFFASPLNHRNLSYQTRVPIGSGKFVFFIKTLKHLDNFTTLGLMHINSVVYIGKNGTTVDFMRTQIKKEYPLLFNNFKVTYCGQNNPNGLIGKSITNPLVYCDEVAGLTREQLMPLCSGSDKILQYSIGIS